MVSLKLQHAAPAGAPASGAGCPIRAPWGLWPRTVDVTVMCSWGAQNLFLLSGVNDWGVCPVTNWSGTIRSISNWRSIV